MEMHPELAKELEDEYIAEGHARMKALGHGSMSWEAEMMERIAFSAGLCRAAPIMYAFGQADQQNEVLFALGITRGEDLR